MFLYYLSQVQIHKIEIRQSIANAKSFDTSVLAVFHSGNKNFELEDSHELRSKGKMYDLVKTVSRQNEIIYYAVADEAEDILLAKAALCSGNNAGAGQSQEKKTNFEIVKFVNRDGFCSAIPHPYLQNPFTVGISKECIFYTSPFSGIVSPPPRNENIAV